MSDRPHRPAPKPWPMKWVVAAIVVFVAGYTVVNLVFRKPGKPAQPAQDMRDRATAARLQEAGWQRSVLPTRRPVEKPETREPAPVKRGAVGLGLDLDACFVEKPRFVSSVDQVSAPASIARGEDYTIHFTAGIADQHYQLGEVMLLQRGTEFALVPVSEPLPGKNLLSRWDDARHAVTLPTRELAPGRYSLRLIAAGPAALWSVEVR